MKIFKLLIVLISVTSFGVLAKEPIKIGILGDIETEGFFSSTLTSFSIQEVTPNSPAEKAGIIAGQKIIAIENCHIPGCASSEAKKLMKKESGETLNLLLENKDGSHVPVKVVFNAG
ncbi:PDZ domain-containing protein [Shewanella sp. AS16]|uniref:PDZ domain-containing protein n=1 Tax=Shewanella sp. AS16 TaxID=2907625 RepID=UPI001F340BF1|nr:PDZ domain-containing protein [Shewanella sp. AS16]MCE9687394.1 PDZ domain-containing protein [Shewanella sp. AS16]